MGVWVRLGPAAAVSGFTFRLWLSASGTDLAVVGLTAWIGLAYSLKFLWAPLLDQRPPLRMLRGFGRRRGWLLLVQPALAAAAVLLALSHPAVAPVAAFAAAASVAVLSATQDIAIDAWRIEIFPERRQGVALAAYVWGYRIAMLVPCPASSPRQASPAGTGHCCRGGADRLRHAGDLGGGPRGRPRHGVPARVPARGHRADPVVSGPAVIAPGPGVRRAVQAG